MVALAITIFYLR